MRVLICSLVLVLVAYVCAVNQRQAQFLAQWQALLQQNVIPAMQQIHRQQNQGGPSQQGRGQETPNGGPPNPSAQTLSYRRRHYDDFDFDYDYDNYRGHRNGGRRDCNRRRRHYHY
jgi:hypothetical protein